MTILRNSCLLCLFINLFSINLCQNKLENNTEWIDPDVKLCKELFIDAAVSSDDGIDYIFKDEYYWPISSSDGLSDEVFGERISERWPNLPTPIDAAFTLVETNGTVFIKDKHWFLYTGNQLIDKGVTTNWNGFTQYPIDAAFTYFNSPVDKVFKNPIYFLFNFTHYSKYVIRDMTGQPQLNYTSQTWTNLRYLLFLQDDLKFNHTMDAIVPNVTAILCNKQHMIFFGTGRYCRANNIRIAPICKDDPLNDFFNCQRNPRPITTTTKISPTTPILTTNASEATTEITTTITASTDNPCTVWPTDSSSMTTTKNSGSTQVSRIDSKGSNQTYIWVIIILVITAIVIIVLILFFMLTKPKNNKTNVETPKIKAEPDLKVQNVKSFSTKSESLNTSMKKIRSTLRDTSQQNLNADFALAKENDTEADQIMTQLKELKSDPQIQ